MKVAIYGKQCNSEDIDNIKSLLLELSLYKVVIFIYKPLYEFIYRNEPPNFTVKLFYNHNELSNNIDLLLSVGGDGTFLDSLTHVRDKAIPILGVNTGRLGFLSTTSLKNIEKTTKLIIDRKYTIESRTMLELVTGCNNFNNYNMALNDITIQKTDATLITIHVYLNNNHLNSYWADGLIIATPTGSTAYSLSVGGPIVMPSLNNFIISPIAPHNLTVRPVVIPDEYEIKIRVESRNKKYVVSLDHRSEHFDVNNQIHIKKAKNSINIINLEKTTYYETLRNKLMWGIDKRN